MFSVAEQQIRDLLAFVDATRGDAPVLIGGDFNTTADARELAPLHTEYIDAYANAHAGIDLNGPLQVTLNPLYTGAGPASTSHSPSVMPSRLSNS